MTSRSIPLYRFWAPRYWPTWLGVGLLRLIVALPQPLRMAIGRGLGRLARRLLGRRRRIVARNLELCFPELDPAARENLERRHFESLGMGVIELGMSWWLSPRAIERLVEIEGLEHAQAGLAAGNGVLLWSGHFATMELAGCELARHLPPIAAMYRPSKNPLNDQLVRRCRSRSVETLITKKSVKLLLQKLRQNRPVWYAADQAYSRKGTVLVDFFGEPAMTNTSVSQIARVSGAAVVPFLPVRLDNGRGYRLELRPALENFPGTDAAEDARRLNAYLEEQIRKAPEQYYWVHRRFKGRPEGYPDPYS